jgi:hypothetical protein
MVAQVSGCFTAIPSGIDAADILNTMPAEVALTTQLALDFNTSMLAGQGSDSGAQREPLPTATLGG